MKKMISVAFKIDRRYLNEFPDEWTAEKIFKTLLEDMIINELQVCASKKEIFEKILQDLEIKEMTQ